MPFGYPHHGRSYQSKPPYVGRAARQGPPRSSRIFRHRRRRRPDIAAGSVRRGSGHDRYEAAPCPSAQYPEGNAIDPPRAVAARRRSRGRRAPAGHFSQVDAPRRCSLIRRIRPPTGLPRPVGSLRRIKPERPGPSAGHCRSTWDPRGVWPSGPSKLPREEHRAVCPLGSWVTELVPPWPVSFPIELDGTGGAPPRALHGCRCTGMAA